MTGKNDKKTLTDEEIVTAQTITRRSTLSVIGATVVGAAVAAAVGLRGKPAEAQATDHDTGPNADAPGHGRTGNTDRDNGPHADGPGHGVCASRGTTDQDAGNGADGAGHGRGPCHQ